MPRKKFKWTRQQYRKAHSLARFMGRHLYCLPDYKPRLLERYFELWDRQPVWRGDPLLTPLHLRYGRDDIPF